MEKMINLQTIYPTAIKRECWVDDISYNSQKIGLNTVFIALAGTNVDGHAFAAQAYQNGAKMVVVERFVDDVDVDCQIIVEDTHFELSKLSQLLHPTTTLKMIGVTGTDGKTSTASILQQLLLNSDQAYGYIGTNGIMYNQQIKNLSCTTPLAPELHAVLAEMESEQIAGVVMEVSSHALATQRVEHLAFQYAIFTNLTHDHLDFHKTMENYLLAKTHLFELLVDDGIAIINNDDQFSETFKQAAQAKTVLTYGSTNASDMWFDNLTYSLQGMHFDLHYQNNTYTCNTRLLGEFNVYNMMAALLVWLHEGGSVTDMPNAIAALNPVAGRMELFHHRTRDMSAIVDFAHAPNAIENVLLFARKIAQRHVIVVTGAVGDGDALKRPFMAEACIKHADTVIFTTDQPYSEDPETIIDDMVQHLSPTMYQRIIDREQAITTALNTAQQGDVVVVLGKGRETEIKMAGQVIQFSDYEYVKQYMMQK